MKKIATVLIMTAIALTLSAQGQNMAVKRQAEGYMRANPRALNTQMLSNLTTEQQQKIESLRLKHQKESLLLANEIREKRAQLRTLEQVDKPNMKAINSKIDEISDLQNKKMKLNAEHKSKVREQLTDEQRVQFDMRSGRMMGNQRQFRNR